MNNQQQVLTDLDSRIRVLKEVFKSSRIAYNTLVFQVDTKQTIHPKTVKIIEKGLGLKLMAIDLVIDNMRLTFEVIKGDQ